jgi:hypothetical protein
MKYETLKLAVQSLMLMGTFGFCPQLSAQTTGNVRVTAIVKTEHDDPEKSIAEVVKKHLEIELSGSPNLQGEIKVTCTFFADDLSANKIIVLKSNDLKVMLEPGKRASVVSPAVVFNFTPAHSEKSGGGKRAKYKRIEATGNRYHGWGIRVYLGANLVGEAYSNSDIKKLLSSPN